MTAPDALDQAELMKLLMEMLEECETEVADAEALQRSEAAAAATRGALNVGQLTSEVRPKGRILQLGLQVPPKKNKPGA